MTNHTQMQGQTITISAPVTLAFDKQLRMATAERDMPSKAASIRQAIGWWLDTPPCPQCDAPTTPHPDPAMVGVRWCSRCQEAVGYDPPNTSEPEAALAPDNGADRE